MTDEWTIYWEDYWLLIEWLLGRLLIVDEQLLGLLLITDEFWWLLGKLILL